MLRQNRGQLIVEYILLIVIVTVAAAMISKMMVGRGDGSQGVIIIKWTQLLNMVGEDQGD